MPNTHIWSVTLATEQSQTCSSALLYVRRGRGGTKNGEIREASILRLKPTAADKVKMSNDVEARLAPSNIKIVELPHTAMLNGHLKSLAIKMPGILRCPMMITSHTYIALLHDRMMISIPCVRVVDCGSTPGLHQELLILSAYHSRSLSIFCIAITPVSG